MNAQQPEFQPVFDPNNFGASIDMVRGVIQPQAPLLYGLMSGETGSRLKGDGYDINGVREYQIGDDLRHVDWSITARQVDKKLQIRERYREITPSVWVVTDMLQSRHAHNPGHFSEQNLALSAITSVLRIADLQGMPTAVIASNDSSLTAVNQREPKQGRAHLRSTMKQLVAALPATEAGSLPERSAQRREIDQTRPRLDQLLHYASKRCTESIVVVVSDFRDTAYPDDAEHGWSDAYRQLARRGNDLIAIETTNPYDFGLPETAGRVAGAGQTYTMNDTNRRLIAAATVRQQAEIDAVLAANKAQHITLTTTDPQWSKSFKQQLRAS